MQYANQIKMNNGDIDALEQMPDEEMTEWDG